MDILEQDELFLVIENGITIYTAKTLEEAEGFISWKQRPNAGNTSEDCNCSSK
mgnify:CR=1 FL=1